MPTGEDALHETFGSFLARLAAAEPAPGGGSAAAYSVAMAAALVRSVALMSESVWPEALGIAAQAEAIEERALPLVDLDAERYEAAMTALAERDSIPAGERDARIGDALSHAAGPLLEIAEAAADAADLAVEAAENADARLRADAYSAAVLSEAAVVVALSLVEINLGVGREDPRVDSTRGLVERAGLARARAASAVAE